MGNSQKLIEYIPLYYTNYNATLYLSNHTNVLRFHTPVLVPFDYAKPSTYNNIRFKVICNFSIHQGITSDSYTMQAIY